MKRSSWRPGSIALALGIALISTACGTQSAAPAASSSPVSAEWQKVIDAAGKEGSVIWYSSAPPAARDALASGFKAKYPAIKVEIRALNTADMEAALQTEHDSHTPGADVVSNVDYSWIYQRLALPGWMVDLQGSSFKDPDWVKSGYVLQNKAVIAPIGLVTIAWNTQLYPSGIKTYNDLLNPKLGNGAIGIVDPTLTAVYADWWSFVEKQSPNFVDGMAKQHPKFYPSAAVMEQALTAGEIAIAAFSTAADMSSFKAKGAPVDFVVPNPAWTAQNIFYAVQSAGHPNAAQLFLDYMGGADGQAAIAKFGVTPLTKVQKATLGGTTSVTLVNLNNMLDPKWVADYNKRWRQAFGR